MSHAIYQTQAIVLGSRNFKESNKLITLFTREFGLLRAHTQSSRELKSKMRAHLGTLSVVDVDLVRGRDMWRMTGIHTRTSGVSLVQHYLYSTYVKIADILKRLLVGEDPHTELFNDIISFFDLATDTTLSRFISEIEIIMMARILNHLGYWNDDSSYITDPDPYKPEVFQWVSEQRSVLVQKINHGLEISQL